MSTFNLDNTYLRELAEEHRKWLSTFNARHRANWERLLKGDAEASFCEAAVRRILQERGILVEPNERLKANGSGPDFRCEANGSAFYVEVTCILCSTATEKTAIPEEPGIGPFAPYGLTDAVFNECIGKAKQCSDMDAPTLVAVGTFHSYAALACIQKPIVSSFLTGKSTLAWNIDISTGKQVGNSYQLTKLEKAAFLKPDPQQEVGFARSSISAILICGLGSSRCLGVLHPNSVRPFDPVLIPDIEFGQVELDFIDRTMRVNWPKGYDG